MAIEAFNCNKIKRSLWPFTFKDKVDEEGNVIEKGKKIMVRMPSKATFEKIQAIQDIQDSDSEIIRAEETIIALHELIGEILTNNLENHNPKKPRNRVTIADLEDYDIEESIAIIKAFSGFMDELKNDPN